MAPIDDAIGVVAFDIAGWLVLGLLLQLLRQKYIVHTNTQALSAPTGELTLHNVGDIPTLSLHAEGCRCHQCKTTGQHVCIGPPTYSKAADADVSLSSSTNSVETSDDFQAVVARRVSMFQESVAMEDMDNSMVLGMSVASV